MSQIDNVLFWTQCRGSPQPRPGRRRACPRQVSLPRCSRLPGRPPPSVWSWRWGNSTGSEERGGEWEEGLVQRQAGRDTSLQVLPGRGVLTHGSSEHLAPAGSRDCGDKGSRRQKHLQGLKYYKIIYTGWQPALPVKGWVVNSLGFVGCPVSVPTRQHVYRWEWLCPSETLFINIGLRAVVWWPFGEK